MNQSIGTVAQALAYGAELLFTNPALRAHAREDADLLLRFVMRCDRATFLAWPARPVDDAGQSLYRSALDLRLRGTPIQYITGTQEFYGLPFLVTPAVLIPRPETEHLVEAALALLPKDSLVRILDIGTGSGAIAVALAHHLPLARITALDLSREALTVARTNADSNHVEQQITFLESDLFSALAGTAELFDCIVSNPPYIADSDRPTLAAEVRDYEPSTALFSGPTGYEIYARLIPDALPFLRPGASLLLEIGYGQQPRIAGLLASSAYTGIRFLPDLQGIPRVAVAQKQ